MVKQEFIKPDKKKKQALLKKYKDDGWSYDYEDVIRAAIEYKYGIESEIFVKVDEGDYQGDTVLVCKDKNDMYYYYKYGWGSCSGCDELQSKMGYQDDGGDVWEMVGEYIPVQLTKDKLVPYMEAALKNSTWNDEDLRKAIVEVKQKFGLKE